MIPARPSPQSSPPPPRGVVWLGVWVRVVRSLGLLGMFGIIIIIIIGVWVCLGVPSLAPCGVV